MLAGQQTAGPAEAGLDLIEDQHDPVLITPFSQQLEEWRGGRDEAPLTRHRLDDDRRHIGFTNLSPGHLRKGSEGFPAEAPLELATAIMQTGAGTWVTGHTWPAVEVGIGGPVDLRGKGGKAALVWIGLRGQSHRHVGATMIAVLKGNHRLPAGCGPGKLDGILDRLGT